MNNFEPLIVDADVLDDNYIIDADIFNEEDIVEAETGIEIRPIFKNGTDTYDDLADKPHINEHELRAGENTLKEIGIGLATNTDINNLFR